MEINAKKQVLQNRLDGLVLLSQTNFGTGQFEEYERNQKEMEDIKKELAELEAVSE